MEQYIYQNTDNLQNNTVGWTRPMAVSSLYTLLVSHKSWPDLIISYYKIIITILIMWWTDPSISFLGPLIIIRPHTSPHTSHLSTIMIVWSQLYVFGPSHNHVTTHNKYLHEAEWAEVEGHVKHPDTSLPHHSCKTDHMGVWRHVCGRK